MKSLGVTIRALREKEGMSQRKLAQALDVDVAVLSRIENEDRFPRKRMDEIIRILSEVFRLPEKELRRIYLSDQITSILRYEADYEQILRVSEEKIQYVRDSKTA